MIKSLLTSLNEEYINDYNAWKYYNILRLHFQTSCYNVEKYGFTNEKYGWEQYKKASDFEVRLFDKLAKHYQLNTNYITSLAANFFYIQPKGTWEIPSVDELQHAYIKLKKFKMSPKFYLDEDLTFLKETASINILKIINNNVPDIYNLAHNGFISYESLILIDFSTGISKYVSKHLSDSLMWTTYKSKYFKYMPFVCTHISKEMVTYIQTQLKQLQS